MTSIQLRYRNSLSDPWILPPSLAGSFPAEPSGSLPLSNARLRSSPELVTPCGCAGESAIDDYYALHASLAPMPQSSSNDIIMYLLHFKQASYRELQYSGYANGSFTSVSLSNIDCTCESGMCSISFRLAAPIAEVV